MMNQSQVNQLCEDNELSDGDLEAISGGWGNEEWDKCRSKYHYLSR